jgi:hypothetical protein
LHGRPFRKMKNMRFVRSMLQSARSSGPRSMMAKISRITLRSIVRMRPDGRFRKALELLDKAHNDTAQAEDVPQARGMRDRAVHHIDQAHGTVDDAIRRTHWEEWRGM